MRSVGLYISRASVDKLLEAYIYFSEGRILRTAIIIAGPLRARAALAPEAALARRDHSATWNLWYLFSGGMSCDEQVSISLLKYKAERGGLDARQPVFKLHENTLHNQPRKQTL
jgi:hypothetical protein